MSILYKVSASEAVSVIPNPNNIDDSTSATNTTYSSDQINTLLSDKQPKTLSAPITIGGQAKGTVETALNALNTFADSKAAINDTTASANTTYSSNKIGVLLEGEEISKTTTGTSFVLTDAADAPLAGLVIDGNSRESKNIWNDDVTIYTLGITRNDHEYTFEPFESGIETLVFSKTFSGSNTYTFSFEGKSESDGTVIRFDGQPDGVSGLGLDKAVVLTTAYTRYSFSGDVDSTYYALRFYRTLSNVGYDKSINIRNIQLELGSTPTPYEPYGIISVGDNGLSVTACGKNLFDNTTTMITGALADDGTITGSSTTAWRTTEFIPISPGNYCMNYAYNGRYYCVCWYDSNQNYLGGISDTSPITFIIPQNAKFIRYSINLNDFNTFQLELGSTATPYEPYKGSTAVVSTGLPLCSVGDIKDEANFTKGIVIKRTKIENGAVVVLDTPIEMPMTASELAAYHSLRTFENTTNITCTDSPQMTLDYLLNTENGAAVGKVAANFVGVMYSLMPYPNAGAHNAIYRGKYLGSSVTDDQWAMIDAGSFDDLFIGDYWTIGGVNYRIAAMDHYLGTGDTACSKHHAVIVPDTKLYSTAMNTSATTAGGYVGSKMYTTNIPTDVLPIVETAFGANHILERRESLCNAVTNGIPSGGVWSSVKVVLMTEMNVLGGRALSPTSNGSDFNEDYPCDSKQFPLFAFAPAFINIARENYWLRDIVNSERFAYIVEYGFEAATGASSGLDVRPSFSIYAG